MEIAQRQPRRLRAILLAAVTACLSACGLTAATLTEEDWSSSRFETLLDKAMSSPLAAAAIYAPELASTADLKTLAGIARRMGWRVEKDVDAAATLLSAACDEGQQRACRDYGKLLIETEQPDGLPKAIALFSASCEAGILFGCSDMARAHSTSEGVAKDETLAFAFADRACAKPGSDVCLGAIEFLAQVNLAEGLARFDRSCDAGQINACHWSGYHRMESEDSSHYAAGMTYFDRACATGHISACEGAIIDTARGLAKSSLLDTAIVTVEAACEEGYVDACIRLMAAFGETYGKGLAPDPARVLGYMQTGCAYGHQDSCRWLAEAYEAGNGTPKDPGEAVRIYRMMCDAGDQRMCQQAARVEASLSPDLADAPPTDVARAVVDRACELGDGEACRGIAWGHVFGEQGREKNAARAALHFRIGCDKGAANSCIDIGSLNEWAEHGFTENKEAARSYYKRACDLGEALGCRLLEESEARAG